MDERFTTAPRPLSLNAARQARIIWNVPIRFTSYVRVNSLVGKASRSACGMKRVVPAQLIKASSVPKVCRIDCAAATQLASSVTFSMINTVRAPWARQSAATASASTAVSASSAQMPTSHPCEAK